MCGASSQQKQIEASQAAFYDTLTSEYKTVFGESQEIMHSLTKAFTPILNAGINQEGFSRAELNNLNSQAVAGTGENYAKAAEALSKQEAAAGGGNTYIPSGASMQRREQLATSAAQNESAIESGILANDYAQGRANYLAAAEALGGVASELNPAGFANSATGAGSAAATTANEITQANNSWMNLVGGALGAAGTAAGGYFQHH